MAWKNIHEILLSGESRLENSILGSSHYNNHRKTSNVFVCVCVCDVDSKLIRFFITSKPRAPNTLTNTGCLQSRDELSGIPQHIFDHRTLLFSELLSLV